MSDNLPDWSGAAVAYSRAYKWMAAISAESYAAHHVKRVRRDPAFHVPDDVRAMRDALAIGDEEAVKALNYTYRRYWLA